MELQQDVTLATPEASTARTAGAAVAGRKPKRLTKKKVGGHALLFSQRVLVLVVIVAAWWLVAHYKWYDRTVTSTPYQVGDWLQSAVRHQELWINLKATLEASLIAFGLASVVGVTIGIGLALLPRFERVVDPYISAFNAMPRIALAPIFIVAFGLTIQEKVALAFTIVVFILITAARAGVRSADLEHIRLATVLGVKRRQMFTKILFPVAVPSIFGGLRLAVIYALLGTLVAELLGSNSGIGQQLQQASGVFRTDEIYGLLIVLAVTATILNMLMGVVERYLLRWQPPATR